MPGKFDGKSRPSNNRYRRNWDDIFKSKTQRIFELKCKINDCRENGKWEEAKSLKLELEELK